MSLMSFGDAEYAGKRRRNRREVFLTEMDKVVPWPRRLALIEPAYPKAGIGRPPYPLATMLRVHMMQNWFGLSEPGMEVALYQIAPQRQFAHLSLTRPIPEEATIHIGADVDSGLVHTVTTTAANASDVSQVEVLLHGKEDVVHADAGYIGAQQRVKSGKRDEVKAIQDAKLKQIIEDLETLKARIRAVVEHPSRVIKRQFGFMKVRFMGLAKNTA